MDGERHMDPAIRSGPKLTYEDCLNFPDDGRRHEIIDGEHFVTPSPNTRHQELSVRLAVALANYLEAQPVGRVFTAPYDVVLSNVDVVEPDLLVVLADQADIVTTQHVRGAPALVVEILSPGTRKTDEATKRRLYDRAGVREYWIVDPELDLVKIHRRGDELHMIRAAELSSERDDILTSPYLPGFSLPLAGLFR